MERTEHGLVAAGEGWFVLNAREARWRHRPGRGESLPFEGETDFPQVGINVSVLGPGTMGAGIVQVASQAGYQWSPATG